MCSSPTSARDRVMAMVWYEIKKILLRPSCQVALLLLLLLSGRFCVQVMWGAESAYWITEAGERQTGPAAMKKLRAAQQEWSGPLDQELLRKALAELKRLNVEGKAHPENPDYAFRRYQGLMPIRDMLNFSFKSGYRWEYQDFFLAETLDESQLPKFYENRVTRLKQWLYDETDIANTLFTEEEKQYLIHNYESVKTPFQVGYTTGWDMAWRVSYYIILYGSLFITFLVSGIFANEFRWKADSVYFSTELGRKRGTLSKLAAGFLLTTLVFWGILLSVNLLVLGIMGFDGWNCSIQTGKGLWRGIYNVTFAQRNLLSLMDGYLLWMFLSGLVMLVSAVSRSVSLAVVVPSLLMLGTDYLDRSGVVSSASKVLQLFPHKMANVDYASRGIVLYSVFGKIMPPIAIQRVLYPCLTVAMGLLAYELFRRKQIR